MSELSPLENYFQQLDSALTGVPVLRRNQIMHVAHRVANTLKDLPSFNRPYTYGDLETYLGPPAQVAALAQADTTVIKAGEGAQVIAAAANPSPGFGVLSRAVRQFDADTLKRYGDQIGSGSNQEPAEKPEDKIDGFIQRKLQHPHLKSFGLNYYLPLFCALASLASAWVVPIGFFIGLAGAIVGLWQLLDKRVPSWTGFAALVTSALAITISATSLTQMLLNS